MLVRLFDLKFISQKNQGQGIARNKGIDLAEGVITVFIGDDIYIEPNFLELTAKFHNEKPEENMALLGYTDWHRAKQVSNFMEWLTNGGPQFAYNKIKDKTKTSFWFFYTSNISLKTSVLKKEHFDEDFNAYGWEDIELGYRLQKKFNLKIYFDKEILAHHDHKMEENDLKVRMTNIAKNAITFQKKHPEINVIPSKSKKVFLILLTNKIVIGILKLFKILSEKKFGKYYWYILSKRYFLEGFKKL